MTFHHDEIDFDAFFNPKRLAMIGATPNPDKWGYMILSNIINGGFKGEIYPVNPKHDKILDIKCYPSIAEIPSTIDLAVISTPVNSVMTVVDECIKKSIPAAIVITSGFSETGQEGLKSERILVQKARDGGMRLMGPNTMGLFSAKSSLTALMPATKPSSGNVSMVSQSGNVGTQLMGWGVQVGIGFSRFVSSGNEGDITCMDYVQNFASDEDTKVIFVYMESLKKARLDPGKIREVVKKKPILVFKGGKTKMGLLAAASHTGAIAGSLDIYEGYFRQSGMIEIKSTLEFIDVLGAFVSFPIPKGKRIGILTGGGGWGVITTDACESEGLEIPHLPNYIVKEIDKILPEYWSKGNPVDMVASIGDESRIKCLRTLIEWDGIDGMIQLGSSAGVHSIVKDMMVKYNKPIITVAMGEDEAKSSMENFGFVTYTTPERAVRAMKNLVQYSEILNNI